MEISQIINAISIKLYEEFGDGYTIYDDSVPQGFKTPAFLILFLSLQRKQRMGNRYHISTLFNIQYFTDQGRTDAADKSLKIQQALTRIRLNTGAIMMGTNAESEIVDGVDHNQMNFNFHLYEYEVPVFMESLTHRSNVKG